MNTPTITAADYILISPPSLPTESGSPQDGPSRPTPRRRPTGTPTWGRYCDCCQAYNHGIDPRRIVVRQASGETIPQRRRRRGSLSLRRVIGRFRSGKIQD
ncbi:hypothetical protein M501DRAFT_1016701 [Patellaria atrata CBS 101060]|uniref:Uncharacterized protein n=1 Tax=Patellaria atrata CBS 101060 TaxID=1346257 RepID=A0A9P4SBJ6_9PEZI|nr:hypothetical protein M501DRAFT_1016701 [Patellaria atrata CBS 101060]